MDSNFVNERLRKSGLLRADGTISSDHHYIPKFYLKGFTNEDGKFYVYNKKTDRIKWHYPESIFYEKNRNTINILGTHSDMIEQIYQKIENKLAPIFKRMQECKDAEEIEENEIFFAIGAFLTINYYRLPANRLKLIALLKEVTTRKDCNLKELNEILKFDVSDSDKWKLLSVYLPLIDFLTHKIPADKSETGYKAIKFTGDILLLSDKLFIHRKEPERFVDLLSDVIIPVTSNTLYMTLSGLKYNITMRVVELVNFITIIESNRFIASPNREYLENCKTLYNLLFKGNDMILPALKSELFDIINNDGV